MQFKNPYNKDVGRPETQHLAGVSETLNVRDCDSGPFLGVSLDDRKQNYAALKCSSLKYDFASISMIIFQSDAGSGVSI